MKYLILFFLIIFSDLNCADKRRRSKSEGASVALEMKVFPTSDPDVIKERRSRERALTVSDLEEAENLVSHLDARKYLRQRARILKRQERIHKEAMARKLEEIKDGTFRIKIFGAIRMGRSTASGQIALVMEDALPGAAESLKGCVGYNPLQYAVSCNSYWAIEPLVKAGFGLDWLDHEKNQNTLPIKIAFASGHEESIAEILRLDSDQKKFIEE